MKVNYEESCKKASFIGYESKPDPDAYNGVAYINKDGKTESIKGKLPSTGISQINTFIAGLFALIIAGVLTIFKRKKR